MSAKVNKLRYEIDGERFDILVSRKRMKNARLRIESDLSVHVSVPLSYSSENISALLAANRSWLGSKLTKLRRQQQSYTLQEGQIFYRGPVWENIVLPALSQHVNVEPSERRIYSGTMLRGETLVEWYKSEAKFHIPARLRQLAQAHGFDYKSCTVRQTKRKWGSWRSDGVISINSKLILAQEDVCDAILLHELAHTVHADHSKAFWTLLYSICPHWDEASLWLKQHNAHIESLFKG